MRILFIACHQNASAAHLVPLIVLKRLSEKEGHETAFLLPKLHHDFYKDYLKMLNVNLLNVQYDGTTSSLMKAYSIFKPQLIIDDLSFTAGYFCELVPIPRIAISRTGAFPHAEVENPKYKHSSLFDPNKILNVAHLGIKRFETLPEFVNADVKIIPGVRSVEVLHERVAEDRTYFFAGPLILEDLSPVEMIEAFLNKNKNKNKKKVYLTYGTGQEPHAEIHECMQFLLDRDISVITNIYDKKLSSLYGDRFYYDSYLPMHFICSNVDLAVHQCGSGTYHYPLVHLVSSITIGTMCYDRELPAQRLKTLGVSDHIAAPTETEDFVEEFKVNVEKFFSMNAADSHKRQQNLQQLKEEIIGTQARFHIQAAIDMACKKFETKSTKSTISL